jgi:tRNA/tmRNA/rRNA uracil-C5-methylase (TrmA/RlmC/RlmD family)
MKLVALIAAVLVLVSCSSKRIMRDCRSLSQGYFECSKP